jgi:hypothetical protein
VLPEVLCQRVGVVRVAEVDDETGTGRQWSLFDPAEHTALIRALSLDEDGSAVGAGIADDRLLNRAGFNASDKSGVRKYGVKKRKRAKAV